MRQIRQLGILLGLLALSVLSYIGAGLIMRPEAVLSVDTALPTAVLSVSEEEIASVTWDNGTEKLTAVRAGGAWSFQEDPAFPLQKGKVEELLDAVLSLRADKSITPEGGLDAYGLGESAEKIALKLTDGTDVVLLIGNRTSVGDQWYLKRADEDQIRLAATNLPATLAKSKLDYAQMEALPTILSPTSFTMRSVEDGSFVMEHLGNPEEYTYTNYYTWFEPVRDSYRPLDRAKAEDLISGVLHVDRKSVADVHPADFSAYGLDRPAAVLEVTDGEKTAGLLLGSRADQKNAAVSAFDSTDRRDASGDGAVETNGASDAKGKNAAFWYVMLENGSMVYTISDRDYQKLIRASYETLRPEDICRMDWPTVTGMDFETPEWKREIAIEALPDTPDESKKRYLYTEQGAEVSYETMTEIKAMIDKMTPNRQLEESADPAGSELRLSVTFHRDAARDQEMALEFYHYSDQYDLVRFNGETRQLISVHAADAVIRLCDRL